MNSENTIVYVRVAGRVRDGFLDPPKFHWDLERDKSLWSSVSKLDNTKKTIDWKRLSREFKAPEHFIRKRSYTLFAKHLKLLERQIEAKTRSLAVTEDELNYTDEDEERASLSHGERDFEAAESLKNLRTSKVLKQRVPGEGRNGESSLSELSNLSVSISALEEALLDRLQL
ncbi:LAQU0S01e05292g1_1 [Lachancea quebecensis]|uniref:Autophagy-related protein 29 n=1 Tax=Lachancea quebecensis TaxID=1654605 RepID=A0A0P1KLT2_9SACH|nr:LAQU0S01e05292g1_1 [Lachancea quebecensis]